MSSITFKKFNSIRVDIGKKSSDITVIVKPNASGAFKMIYHIMSDSCFFKTPDGSSKTLTINVTTPQANNEYDTSFTIEGDIEEPHFARIFIELEDDSSPQSPRRPIIIKP